MWTPGETFIGGVLRPTRRVGAAAGGWQIEQTPAPAKFHPVTLYAMGLLAKEQLPEVTLFDDQAQFSPTSISTPPIGQPVTGTTHSATIYNVIGMLGERTGPTPSEWHRATIVVSRDGLLSSREMDYWTFFAQRLEDPNRSGVLGYDGIGSFERATDGRVDLKTDIRPLTAPRMVEPLDVDFPPFAARDFRDVQFDALVPSRFHPGDTVRWSGRVNAPDTNDVNAIIIQLWKSGGTRNDALRVQASGELGLFIHCGDAHRREGTGCLRNGCVLVLARIRYTVQPDQSLADSDRLARPTGPPSRSCEFPWVDSCGAKL